MPNGSGPLDFNAYLKTTDFEAGTQRIINAIRNTTTHAKKEANEIEKIYKKLGGVIGGYLAANELKAFASKIVTVRGEFQQLEIAFTTMLKSKSKADALMGQIVDFAGKTPFNLSEVATGAKQLLAYGSSAEKVIGEIKRLGDIAAGVSAPLGDLIYLYGTLRTQGRAYAVDIRQFAGRGIPIYEELAKVLKINTAEVNNFVEAGKVGFKEVEQAFANMTGAGGIFEGLTEKQSKSLTGLISNFKDALDRMFNDLGKSQEGTLAEIIKGATSVVDNYEEVVKILKVLIATYGIYKAAVIATSVIQGASAAAGTISAWLSLAKSIRTAADAQLWFNLVSKANPYAIVAAAITALAVAVFTYTENLSAAEVAQRNLTEAENQSKKQKEELAKTTNDLVNAIRSETATRFQQLESFEKLKEMYPTLYKEMDIDTYKKKDAIEAQKELNKVLDEINVSEAEDQYRKAIVKVQDLTAKVEELKKTADDSNIIDLAQAITDLQAANIEVETLNIKVKEQKELFYKANTPLEDQIKHYQAIKNNLDETKNRIESTLPPFVSVKKEAGFIEDILRKMSLQNLIADINKVDNNLAELRGKLGKDKFDFAIGLSKAVENRDVKGLIGLQSLAITENQIDDLAKAIKQIKSDLKIQSSDYKALDALYNKLTTKPKREEITPFGSLSYWERIQKKAKELIEKINPFDKSKEPQLAKLQAQKLEADKKIEEINKRISIKTFDETLEEKRKLYDQYTEWVKLKGQQVANQDLADLLKSGESYSAYLKSQISTLEAKIGSGKASDKDRANLIQLKNEDTRVFEQGLEEKKKQYELYSLWVVKINKETADKQFVELIKSGSTIQEYLQNQIEGLRNKINVGVAVEDTDYQELVRFEQELENINGGFEKYKQKILDASESLGSLTEQIAFFNTEQTKISPFDTDKILFLVSQRLEAEKQRKRVLVEYFNDSNLFETKRFAIEKYYKDLRDQLEVETSAGRIKNNKEALDKINQDEKKAFAELAESDAQAILKNSKGYQELQNIILGGDNTVLKSRIESTKKALQELQDEYKKTGKSGLEQTETYKDFQQQLLDYQNQLLDNNLSYFSNISRILAGIKIETRGIIGGIGKLGEIIAVAAQQMENLSKLSKLTKQQSALSNIINNPKSSVAEIEKATKALKSTQKEISANIYSLVIQQGVEFLNDLGNVIQQNKQRNRDYYNLVIAQQAAYNILLNDEIRLKSQKNSLYKGPIGSVIADSLSAEADAAIKLDEALNTLSGGKAKDGTTYGINVLEGLKGALTGVFGALKGVETRDKLSPLLEKYGDLIKVLPDGTKQLNLELAKSLVATNALDDETTKLLQNAIDWQEKMIEANEQLKNSIIDLTGEIGNNLTDALVNAFKSGETAAYALGNTVADVIENIVTDSIKVQFIKPVIDQFAQEVQASYSNTGDMSILDDLERLNKYGLPKLQAGFEEFQKVQEQIQKATGLEIFKKSDGSGSSLSGAIKGMSEETAGVLEGQFNALRITGAQHLEVSKVNLDVSRNILLGISKIAVNSDYLKYLESIDNRLKKIDSGSDLRAGGL
ncbi:tape measure protein [Emticicia sp. BO119]|uniref:tape measure protein n=1 Tax=Emticicia sp. BO119 TaxID=2757768 RepID=UPI0015F09AB5|nr:tape measure protein [Emticicia sp. BO119]MBA4852084.1 hypothetical protein [Emticicia sp. BO119]